jgi:hypothetical protein
MARLIYSSDYRGSTGFAYDGARDIFLDLVRRFDSALPLILPTGG